MYAEIAVNIEAGLANNFHYHFPHAEPPPLSLGYRQLFHAILPAAEQIKHGWTGYTGWGVVD
jgi:hypothetical protein